MQTVRIVVLLLAVVPWSGAACARAVESSALSAKLHATRTSPMDLEISGEVPGIPANQSRFLAREDLLALSQPVTISTEDGNFKSATQVRAIALDKLAAALGVAGNKMIVADCKDKYQAHYPRAYLAAHRPVLVTEMNGAALSDAKEDDYGPYMIAHATFKSAFKTQPYRDEPQIPWGVTGLQFRNEKDVYGPISPRGSAAGPGNVNAGYLIARQNCFRCHNSLDEGGMKSGVNWMALATVASSSPEFFTAYVRDPKSKNPNTKMAASPELDQAAMDSLAAYFRAFGLAAVEASH